jgi:hypothetical protein
MSEKSAAEVHCRLARISSEIVSVTPENALLFFFAWIFKSVSFLQRALHALLILVYICAI